MTTEETGARNKQHRERQIIEAFCAALGAQVVSVSVGDRPDAFVDLQDEGWPTKVGIELAKYHSDAKGKRGSAGRRRDSARIALQEEIRRHAACRAELRDVSVLVLAKVRSQPLRTVWQDFMTQLFDFVAERARQWRGAQRTTHQHFDRGRFPLLDASVSQVCLIHTPGCSYWECSPQADSAGLSAVAMRMLVDNHLTKARGYDWQDAAERWLLVVGGAQVTAPATMLPPDELTASAVASLSVDDLCECSPIDRVFVYEYGRARRPEEIYRRPGLPDLRRAGQR